MAIDPNQAALAGAWNSAGGYGSRAERWNPLDYGSIERRDYYDLGITPDQMDPRMNTVPQLQSAMRGQALFGNMPESALIQRDIFGPNIPLMSDPSAVNANSNKVHGMPPEEVATLQPNVDAAHSAMGTMMGTSTGGGLGRTAMLQAALPNNRRDPLTSIPELSLDLANDKNYGEVVNKRMDSLRIAEVPQIMAEIGSPTRRPAADPNSVDTEFQIDPKTKKPVAAGGLDEDLLNSKTFMYLLGKDRASAARVYEAKTGRNLEQDIQSHVALSQAQKGNREQILEDVRKTLHVDPTTGERTVTAMVKDAMGNMVPQPRALSTVQERALLAEGGTKRLFGFDLPTGIAPRSPLTATELPQYQANLKASVSAHPDWTPEQHRDAVERAGYAEQQAKKTPSGSPPAVSEEHPNLLSFLQREDFEHPIANFFRSNVGGLLDKMDPYHDPSKPTIPLLNTPPMSRSVVEERSRAAEEDRQRSIEAMDWQRSQPRPLTAMMGGFR